MMKLLSLFHKKKISNVETIDNIDKIDTIDRIDNIIPNNINNNYLIKQHRTISEYNYFIKFNKLGNIIYLSNELVILLEYNYYELINKFIGILMNKCTSLYFLKIFLKNYNNKKYIETELLSNNNIKLYNKNNREIIFIIDNLEYNDDNIFNLTLNINQFINLNKYEYLYLYFYKEYILSNKFIESYNNIVMISIDVINSTLLVNNNVENYINIYKILHKNIIHLLKNIYYPYIYIHEILGDSYIFISNFEIVNNTSICTSLCYNFIKDLNNLIKEFIRIRIGMVYGKIFYGLIDNNIRLFGENINKVNRLQSNCIQNNILVCENFYEKLIDEINIFDIKYIIKKDNICLKGFDQTTCYHIEL